MTTNDGKTNLKFFIDAFDAISNTEGESIEEVKKDLTEMGIDVPSAMKVLMGRVREISKAARRSELVLAGERRLAAEQARPSFFGRFTAWTREQVEARIRELAAPGVLDAAFSFRDLQERSEEDLKTLLEDLETAKWRKDHY
jgi:hypothetical protein